MRFFIIALALLQLVAPTWHICEMGSHAAHHQGSSHHQSAASLAQTSAGPLICSCAPHPAPLDPKTPRLDGISPANHATCLAMLLQSMPGQVSAPAVIFEVRVFATARFATQVLTSPDLLTPRRFRGRAPPWNC